MAVRDDAAKIAAEIAELRHAIHREPEMGLDLPKTQRKVLDALDGLPLEITAGQGLSSVTAVLRGGKPGPAVLLRGDMDALPITEATGLPYASRHDGVMHACGHDLHVAMLAGAAKLLSARQAELPGSVIFMFQPGEEGYAGARLMIEEGVLDAAGSRAIAAYGLHVSSSKLPLGMFSTRPGPMLAAADQITVTVHGKGGHASQPHRAADPIPAAAEMVIALQTLVTRRFDVFDPVVITVGSFHAGTTDNVIPDSATFLATARSYSPEARSRLRELVPQLVLRIGEAHGLEVAAEYRTEYPVTVNDAAEAAFASATVSAVFGAEHGEVAANPITGAEDFSFVLEQVPGAFLMLGACPPDVDAETAPSNHSAYAMFDDAVLPDGAAMLTELALRRLAQRLQTRYVRLLGADGFGRGAQIGYLGLGEVALDDPAGAARTDLGLDAQVDAGDAVLAVHPCAHRHDRAGVLGDRAGHPGRGGGRGVVGRAGLQQGDDLAAAIAGAGDQLLDVRGREQRGQRLAVHRAGRRHRHHRVAVRAERQRLDAADRDAQLLRDEVAEPGGVEHAGLADHPARREAGDLGGQRRHLVQRVRDHDQHRLRRVLGDVLHHVTHDLGVDLDQVHPAHAWLARQAGRDDHDAGSGDRLVALAGRSGGLPGDLGLEALDRTGLVHVQGQALGLALDDVGQHDLVEDVVLGQPLRGGGTVETRADDGYLAVACHL
jgi:amidohydrolase